MPRQLVIDSSTIFAFERAKLLDMLAQLPYRLIIPPAVKDEIEAGNKSLLSLVSVVPLKGRSLKKAVSFKSFGVGKGEAECCVLATRLKLDFIVCDDRKFIRQRFLSSNRDLKNVKVIGFSFLLYLLHKSRKITDTDIRTLFEKVIASNNWKRSEVQVSNRRFLHEMGFT